MSEVDIIFNDSRAGKTSVHRMTTGVAQGGSLSSALFDMGIVPSIRRTQLAHPTASIYLIADDNMVVGPPEEAIAAVKTITLLLADVGLTLAATTNSINVIYGLDNQYTDAQRELTLASDLHWIPSTCWWHPYRQRCLHD